MTPWFIATEPFSPESGDSWVKYIQWSGLGRLEEVVSLDSILCPTLLPDIKSDYWNYIVNADYMLRYFVDFDFLMQQVVSVEKKNVLCVFRNPEQQPEPPARQDFEYLGYDLIDDATQISALTNCRGFSKAFTNEELSKVGLLREFDRAVEVQENLFSHYPNDAHADCSRWAIFRLKEA